MRSSSIEVIFEVKTEDKTDAEEVEGHMIVLLNGQKTEEMRKELAKEELQVINIALIVEGMEDMVEEMEEEVDVPIPWKLQDEDEMNERYLVEHVFVAVQIDESREEEQE